MLAVDSACLRGAFRRGWNMVQTMRSGLLRFGLPLLTVGLATALSLLLGLKLMPLLLMAVAVTAWYRGLGPGLVASVLSFLAQSVRWEGMPEEAFGAQPDLE